MIAPVVYKLLSEEECDLWDVCSHFYYSCIDTEPNMLDEVVDYKIRQGDHYRFLAAKEAPYHKGLYNGGISISGKTGKPILIINE